MAATDEMITQISINDSEYPENLRTIPNPPQVIFCAGEPAVLKTPCVTMVGARNASLYGQHYAEKISYDLARHGLTIVSGMARGLDSICHKGALKACGKTVAVFGSGVDITYPPEHKELRRQIEQNGAIISEYPLGTRPTQFTFPYRNRITVGLSEVTIIVECKENSGTWHSVKAARAAGRTLYTIPTTIDNEHGTGNIRLIREGAKVITCADDLLRDLGIVPQEEQKIKKKENDPILACLHTSEPTSVQQIMERTKLSASEIFNQLTMLELDGKIKPLPGRRYLREG